jgi:hypothetical protein
MLLPQFFEAPEDRDLRDFYKPEPTAVGSEQRERSITMESSTNSSSSSSNSSPGSTAMTPEELVVQLRALRQQIPEYSQSPSVSFGILRQTTVVDPNFIDAATHAIGESVTLADAVGKTPEACTLEASDAMRWSAVEEELRAMLKGVSNANMLRRHRIGLTALQAYGMTKQLVRQPEHDDLKPHLDAMKRLSPTSSRRRHKSRPPQTPPQPQTPAQ